MDQKHYTLLFTQIRVTEFKNDVLGAFFKLP